jgi:ABC-type transport system substrate-binding protein
VATITVLLFISQIPTTISSGIDVTSLSGPYVDSVMYKIIEEEDEQVLALQNNEIDMIGGFLGLASLSRLNAQEYIETEITPRNGYGYFTINCAKYPFNITAFRRACAFALDKKYISDDIWKGLAVPQDSCLPQSNPFSIEGMLPFSYYESNIVLGHTLLNQAGFLDADNDSLRESPNGESLHVLIESIPSSDEALAVQQTMEVALTDLGINCTVAPPTFCCDAERVYHHGDYDMMFFGKSFYDFDITWLAFEFWSEYADEPYHNYPNFRNSTYDSWREQLLYSLDYDSVFEAASEMQRIWIYECPMIICYENILVSAYRTDRFEGFVNTNSDGPHSWWTNLKVHLKGDQGGPLGGTLRWSTPNLIETFNFMVDQEGHIPMILKGMYDTLLVESPEGYIIPWLAESYTVETHEDNPAVATGYTRFTFDLLRNATWTDGTPLTAEDVVFSLNYYREGAENPLGIELTSLTAVYTPTLYRVVIDFSTESYWHPYSIGFKPIIPKHIFLESNPDNWEEWDPQPPTESMVTSGPFNVTEFITGDYSLFSYNPNHFRSISRELTATFTTMTSSTTTNPTSPLSTTHQASTTPTITTPITDSIWNQHFLGLSLLQWAITVPSIAVIVVVLVIWRVDTFKMPVRGHQE